jgi:hypothetical protein
MATDHSKNMYYEAIQKDGGWYWKIYHYDQSGNKEIVVYRSDRGYDSGPEAEDACCEFQEANNINAELG